MDDLFKDKRFSHIGSDPRFKSILRTERKIKIDKRFQSVFTDKKFQLKYAVDVRGRPVRETQADNYKKYYEVSSNESEVSTDDDDGSLHSQAKLIEKSNVSDNEGTWDLKSNSINELSSGDQEKETLLKSNINIEKNKSITKEMDELHKTKISDVVQGRLRDMSIDYARGVGTIISDSSSEDSSSDESDSVFVEHPWGEFDQDTETTDEATKRLAICYLDWDRIYAKDLMVLLHSFLSADGIIESVTVYPSEFGLERMKEEELKGPKELVEINEGEEIEDNYEKESEGKTYHMEKLREYQLNRLKYYYAIVVCNSSDTANKLYTECNGMEYESCAAKLDMRFVPDNMTFEQEPREVCTSLPDVTKYKPRLFETSALRQGKVSLTWDETDPRRIEFNKRLANGDNLLDEDIDDYVAISSGESENEQIQVSPTSNNDGREIEEGTKEKISKYRSLIASLKGEEKAKRNRDVDMKITWGAGTMNDAESSDDEQTDGRKINKKSILKNQTTKMKPTERFNKVHVSEDLSTDEDNSLTRSKKKGEILKNIEVVTSDVDENANAELDLLLSEDVEENRKRHFSLKCLQRQERKTKKKAWRKEFKKKINANKEEDNFKVNVADNRFSALYTSHLFNIDPAHPQFKKSRAMDQLVAEKQKRRKLEQV